MKILICNDDGIESEGLKILSEKLSLKNDVMVIAPEQNRSACSHSLTLFTPVKIKKYTKMKCRAYSISGTPADCVKIGFHIFEDFVPDVVVSGINKGHNLGSDILYSGTVSVAMEAAFFNTAAFAFSAFSHGESDFSFFSDYAADIIDNLLPYSDNKTVWNVNFPDNNCKIKGIMLCKLGNYVYNDSYIKNSEGDYELIGTVAEADDNPNDSDVKLIKEGYITVTPLLYDKTDYIKIEELKEKCVKL